VKEAIHMADHTVGPEVGLAGGIVDGRIALPRARAPSRGGGVATAAFDEDVITLGCAAALAVLDANPTVRPRALLLASVSSPFAEGGSAQVIAEVCGLQGPGLHVAEHSGTIAASGAALTSALALAAAGLGPVLLVAGDVRRDARGRALGDGAAALLVDREGAVATVGPAGAEAVLFRDAWRLAGSTEVTTADPSLAKLAPHRRTSADVLVDPAGAPMPRAGMLGCAALPAGLLARLGDADEGDRIAVAVTAGGVLHRFDVVAGPAARAAGAAADAVVAGGVDGPAATASEVAGFDPYASQPRSWRERGQDLRLEGLRDDGTGEVWFPAPPAGPATAGKVPTRLRRRGTVYTTTRDHVFPYGGPLSVAVVELEGGGRFFGQVADGATVAIGQQVELVLRRLHDGGGLPHYFWKVAGAAERPAVLTEV
jgi:uncharacterized OB-fold protein